MGIPWHRGPPACGAHLLSSFVCVPHPAGSLGSMSPSPGRPGLSPRRAHLSWVSFFSCKVKFFPLQITEFWAALAWPMWRVGHQQTPCGLVPAELCVMASCQYRSAHFEPPGGPASKGDTSLGCRDVQTQISALWPPHRHLGFLNLSVIVYKMVVITVLLQVFCQTQILHIKYLAHICCSMHSSCYYFCKMNIPNARI